MRVETTTSRDARDTGRRRVGPVTAALAAGLLLAACTPTAGEDEVSGDGDGDAAQGNGEVEVEASDGTPEQLQLDSDDEWRLELEDPLDKPDLELTDQHGEPYDLREETAGKPTLLFFGFTHCPDFCPAHLSVLSGAMDELSAETTDDIEVVFVTVDPERDTPERLDEYLSGFDESYVGLHGDLDEIEEGLAALNLPEPIFEDADEDGSYYVSHPVAIVAFNPDDDRAHTMYPFGIRRQHWVEELPRLASGEEIG
ncbi:SCO family protein [Egibacter rhizosphaerae]|nr:SCO family protein [Egibacter rhizosphaerae]